MQFGHFQNLWMRETTSSVLPCSEGGGELDFESDLRYQGSRVVLRHGHVLQVL